MSKRRFQAVKNNKSGKPYDDISPPRKKLRKSRSNLSTRNLGGNSNPHKTRRSRKNNRKRNNITNNNSNNNNNNDNNNDNNTDDSGSDDMDITKDDIKNLKNKNKNKNKTKTKSKTNNLIKTIVTNPTINSNSNVNEEEDDDTKVNEEKANDYLPTTAVVRFDWDGLEDQCNKNKPEHKQIISTASTTSTTSTTSACTPRTSGTLEESPFDILERMALDSGCWLIWSVSIAHIIFSLKLGIDRQVNESLADVRVWKTILGIRMSARTTDEGIVKGILHNIILFLDHMNKYQLTTTIGKNGNFYESAKKFRKIIERRIYIAIAAAVNIPNEINLIICNYASSVYWIRPLLFGPRDWDEPVLIDFLLSLDITPTVAKYVTLPPISGSAFVVVHTRYNCYTQRLQLLQEKRMKNKLEFDKAIGCVEEEIGKLENKNSLCPNEQVVLKDLMAQRERARTVTITLISTKDIENLSHYLQYLSHQQQL